MTNRIIEVVRRGASGEDGSFGLTTVSTRNASFTAVEAERAYAYRCTTTMTVSLTAASGLQSGWHALVLADGGDVTIDPDGAELINGLASLTIPNGAMIWLFTDGNAFFAQYMMSELVTDILGSTQPEGIRRALQIPEVETSLTTTGSQAAFEATSLATITAYYPGLRVRIRPHTNNVAGATFNLNGLGARPLIVKGGTAAISGGDLNASRHIDLEYSDNASGEWHVINYVPASETVPGVVERASDQEALAGAEDKFPDASQIQDMINATVAIGVQVIAAGRIDGADGTPEYVFEAGTDGTVVDVGAGVYGIRFETAEDDANYAVLTSLLNGSPNRLFSDPLTLTTAGFDLQVENFNGVATDHDGVYFLAFRIS